MRGFEIIRKVHRSELPVHIDFNPTATRAVLTTFYGASYLVAPHLDVLELGILTMPGTFALLPIDDAEKPRWNEVIDLIVSQDEARRQEAVLTRSYRALLDYMTVDGHVLETTVQRSIQRGERPRLYDLLRMTATTTWAELRHDRAPLGERERVRLHAEVARRAMPLIRTHFESL